MPTTKPKYAPLENHLTNKEFSQIPMTFAAIESIIESNLPPSARKHRAWWSNNPSNSVITFAWLNAGYKTAQVNLENEKLVFVRDDNIETSVADTTKPRHHPIFGCLSGLITIPDDLDLIEPADPDWGSNTYGGEE